MSENARAYLAAQPRVLLGHWPTPLQPCDRLREQIGGPRIWLKRDDCTGLATGGNKTRKLEYLLGKALAEGCDGVITFGALQSNHARQTAAACAKLGLTCDLILTRAVPRFDESYLHSGNLLLDRLLGAELHIVEDSDSAFVTFARLYEQAQLSGRKPFGIVPGGSDSTGVLGYVQGTLELAEQVNAAGLDLSTIVVAASTAGTAAGIVIGVNIAELDCLVRVACVYQPAPVTQQELEALVNATAAELGSELPDRSSFSVSDSPLGEAYGIPTVEGIDAIELLAKTEGVLLDPVYTGKAFGYLLKLAAQDQLDVNKDVVFIHTGGSAGLFAYSSNFSA